MPPTTNRLHMHSIGNSLRPLPDGAHRGIRHPAVASSDRITIANHSHNHPMCQHATSARTFLLRRDQPILINGLTPHRRKIEYGTFTRT